MGNCLNYMNRSVHPSEPDQLSHGWESIPSDLNRVSAGSCTLRVKVRMSRSELEQLMEQADLSKGESTIEIGRLIMQECLNGKLQARIVHGERNLKTITE